MNGFELKELIETTKRRLTENDKLFTKNYVVWAPKDNLPQKQSVVGLLEAREVLMNTLANLEVVQERFNNETMFVWRGKQVSLAYLIKMRGILDAYRTKATQLLGVFESDPVSSYRGNLTTQHANVPVWILDETEARATLAAKITELDEQISKVKGLIAEGNIKAVRE